MSLVELDIVTRTEHPLDVVERLASENEFSFERDHQDEICISTRGDFSDYHVAATWLSDVEALHIACAFDLNVPPTRRSEILNLISLVNEQLWVGHFDLWSRENVVMFRHSLVLAGGAEPTGPQCAALLEAAVDTCDRFYQAFQFVVWAGKSAREAFETAMFETEGEA
jgi:hypothetical protein